MFYNFFLQKSPISFLSFNQKKEGLAYGLKHDVFIFLFLCRVDIQVTKHKLAIKQLIIYFSFLIFFYWCSWLWVHERKALQSFFEFQKQLNCVEKS